MCLFKFGDIKQFEQHGFIHKKEEMSFCCICLRWRIYGSKKEVEQHFKSQFHKTNKRWLLEQTEDEEERYIFVNQSDNEEKQINSLEDQLNLNNEVKISIITIYNLCI